MGTGARNYTDKTIKRLFGLSGNQCAYPGCQSTLVNKRNALDSNICHIEAANTGGERYNSLMTDPERADYENLILLCRQHHDITNDVDKYTVATLKAMKNDHESSYLHQRLKSNPSMLKNTINAISEISFSESPENESLKVVDPKDKIQFNSIQRNTSLIQEYKVFHSKINSLYDELERQGSIKKEKLLFNIRQIYIIAKGKYVLDAKNPLEVIRENSDNIIDDVYTELSNKLESSSLFDEDIVLGIRLILVDSFIRCKILEEPK